MTVPIIVAAWIVLDILLAAAWAWFRGRQKRLTSGPRGAGTSALGRPESAPPTAELGSRRLAVLTSLIDERAPAAHIAGAAEVPNENGAR